MSDQSLPPIQLPPPIVHWVIHDPSGSPPLQALPPHAYLSPQLPPTQPLSQKPIDLKANQRKSSHSAIEKRRREKMNDKIESLKKLIPSCSSPFPTSVQQPIHKLSVLQAAIDYIGQLHEQIENALPEDDPLRQKIRMTHISTDNNKRNS